MRVWRGPSAVGTMLLLTVGCRAPSDGSASADLLAVAHGRLLTGSTPPLEVALSVDGGEGDFPRLVEFDASGSALGVGDPTYEWSFGDGALTRDGPTTVHTYVGAGEFVATLTLVDGSGQEAAAEVTIDISTPDCPDDEPPLSLGDIDDDSLNEISGIAASRIEAGVHWVHQDADEDQIVAIDLFGNTLSEHDLPQPLLDIEDIATVIDPATGVPMLFLGDFGDNDEERAEVALWILEEPDPLVDSVLAPIEVRLTYPYGAVDAEALLVDPFTLDAFVITKDGDPEVFVKRAPHEEGGPFELEALGQFESLDFTATGGDVSTDGLLVVVRGYTETARVWIRNGYRPLEEVFLEEPCDVDIADEDQGEAVTFTIDGRGLVTTSEGEGEAVYFNGLSRD
jgi:hypothetical protein